MKKFYEKLPFRGLTGVHTLLVVLMMCGIIACSRGKASAQSSDGSSSGGGVAATAASNQSADPSSGGKEAPDSNFIVTLTEDNTGAVIALYKGSSKIVVIPATIQGMPVRVIGFKAFFDNRIINSVVIPEGVTCD